MNVPRMTKPWYREPWPWLLMLGPFVVVVAGIVTTWLAVSSSDGLVAEDYYKQALSVDKTLASSALADALGLSVALRATEREFVLKLAARDENFVPPPTLRVTLSHPTRAGLDQSEVFTLTGAAYIGKLRLPRSGHWLVLIEDEPKTWRLMGNVVLPASGETVIAGNAAGRKGAQAAP
jgi:hypothetical protein